MGVWGRQSGKTTYGIDKMIYKPLTGRKYGVYWYVLQTADAAEVAFNRHWEMLRPFPQLLSRKPNESERWIQYPNGAKVYYKSGETFDNLRTETLDGSIIDEVRQQDPKLWPMIIRPMLARRQGWCDFLSTPNGFDHFYDLYQFGLSHPEEWACFHAPSSEAPWWTKEEIESAQSTMSEAEFAQEILAEFRDLTRGKAYLSHGSHNWMTECPWAPGSLYSPHLPIVVGMDFNVGLICWVLGQNRGNQWYFFDEIALRQSHTQQAVELLIQKVRHHKPGIILIGDATGKANKTSAVGQTDYSIIRTALTAAGIRFEDRTPDSNPLVKDRVNLMNAKLKSASGIVNFWYHRENCHYLGRDLDRVVWKEKAQGAILDQTTDRDLTHASDAVGYPVALMSNDFDSGAGVIRVLL